MRIDEIETRFAEIRSEMEQEDADIDALTEEVRTLKEERDSIIAEEEQRKALLDEVAKSGTITERFEEETMPERSFAVDTMEYRDAYLKQLMGRPLDEEERAAMTASAAIPTITADKIVSWMAKYPLVDAVDLTRIPGNVSYPVDGTNADVAWVAMGTAATDSADALGTVSLNAYKLIKTVEITADVQRMSIDAFEDWLVEKLANKMAKAVSNGILNGHGSASNEATGINVTKSTQDGTFTKLGMKWADICAIIGALGSAYLPNASFVMNSQLFFGDVFGMVDSQGRPIVVTDPQAPVRYNVAGFPVILDDNNASNVCLFGDLKAYKFNFAAEPEISHDDSVAFRTGSRVYRALALADGKLADTDAIIRYIRAT